MHKDQPWSAIWLTWTFVVERVKGIEPSLSAWETYRRPRSCWSPAWPWCQTLTSADRASTVLMARQWHAGAGHGRGTKVKCVR